MLRQISNDDAKELFPLHSDKVVMQYINSPMAKSMDDVLNLIKIINDLLNNNKGFTRAII